MLKQWVMGLAAGTLALSGTAFGQENSAGNDETEESVDTITVLGTRTERPISEVPVTISIITSEQLNQELTRDIADLVRYEPGVSVAGTGSRFGLSGFNIRGIGGNRVLTVVDGVRIPEEFSFGPFLSARRDFVDVDSLERAEIARGPISSLYGSDALGGVVSFTTKGPRDYLDGDPLHIGGKLGWSGADASTVGSVNFAAGSERLAGLLVVTQRELQETDNQGSVGGFGPGRELADPQDITSTNVVGKLAWQIAEGHELTLGLDYLTNETDTQILSDYGIVVSGTLVNTRDAVDERDRTRVSLAYNTDAQTAFFDELRASVYTQTSETQQNTFETRTTGAGTGVAQSRERLSFFEQDIVGAFAQLSKAFQVGDTEHVITYGFDYWSTENASLRNGGTFDATGAPTFEFFPLPTRDFPLTDVDQLAFFVQDEIELFGGRLLLTPGLRFDQFEASATADSIYLSGNPGSPTPEDYDDSEVTARLGIVFALTESLSTYALYSEGFRAPPYDDVNVGFSNFIGGYKTIANPNLQSERSEGVEVGVRWQGDDSAISFNVFQTDFEDFIESFAISPQFSATFGIDPADGLLTFQSVNREGVEIQGAELSAQLGLASFPDVGSFGLRSAIAYADGEETATGLPIDSIEPLTAVFGLTYMTPGESWGGELVLTLVEAKDETEIVNSDLRAPTDGYGIVDLLVYGNITERFSVNAGLFNLTDKVYTRWADSAGIGGDAPARFTQPGVNAAVNLRYDF
ncbi:MAG: TonB-dependent hemoglobin/transferrin/lactoferrin family receptor [Pseudomonadota bacterium]